ncbi:MAG: beta-propeller domain-containing protein [Myxococcales bacterium]
MTVRVESWWLALLALLGLAGCQNNGIPKPEPVQQAIALESFDDCAALEKYFEDRAVLAMRARLTMRAETDESWQLGFGAGAPTAEAADGAAANSGSGPAKSTSSSPSAYTTTNTQVEGVDEPDFVKNDATHILVLSGRTLFVNKSWPADQLVTMSKVSIEGWPREMFLDEQSRVVVFSQVYRALDWAADEYACKAGAEAYAGVCDHDAPNTLKVTVIDLADDTAPAVLREEYLPGTYLSARRMGAVVRVVTSDPFRWPAGVRFSLNATEAVLHDKALRVKAFEALMNENETLIRAQTLDQWLPAGERKLAGGSSVAIPVVCSEVQRPNGPTELGILTVATLDLGDATAPVGRTSLLARADEVYASASSLYVANQHWWWWPEVGQKSWTYVHKFDLSSPQKAAYQASGVVEGRIVDQFSMDEHQGYLRLAVMRAERIPVANQWWGRWQTSSRVVVLAQREDTLQLVGETDDLASGEQLFSSRFIGDHAFLVTYRQVDPLFAIDLSDPANPRQVGELKVPGVSTYLHPIDESHLLAVGMGADWAVKLSLFDVGDLSQPKELFSTTVGTVFGDSEATYEHKAFNYFAGKKLLAIPFFDWTQSTNTAGSFWTGFQSSLRVFKVDPATGIHPIGQVDMTDVFERGGSGYCGWDWYWNPGVRRSVLAGDFVYAISDAGIRSANVAALSSPLKTVLFDQPSR